MLCRLALASVYDLTPYYALLAEVRTSAKEITAGPSRQDAKVAAASSLRTSRCKVSSEINYEIHLCNL
jgi:hypothetical protein